MCVLTIHTETKRVEKTTTLVKGIHKPDLFTRYFHHDVALFLVPLPTTEFSSVFLFLRIGLPLNPCLLFLKTVIFKVTLFPSALTGDAWHKL